MSSDEDDDYLSAKYLVETSAATAPKTYSQIRKEAQKQAQLKHEQQRVKGRKQRELESREVGLSKSLFERAKEEEDAGLGSGNKALSIMMKMGFKPGQSLGKSNDSGDQDNEGVVVEDQAQSPPGNSARSSGLANADTASTSVTAATTSGGLAVEDDEERNSRASHLKVPLPLSEWTGKKGIGLGKRARSPSATERLAKMAKMAEDAEHGDYRSRARDEYNNRLAEGRLGPAQRTCTTLDEQLGKEFNALWLNPNNEDSFPPGLMDALTLHSNLLLGTIRLPRQGDPTSTSVSEAQRLRLQMRADSLRPLHADGDDESPQAKKSAVSVIDQYSSDMLEEATQFLRLQSQDRLQLVLSYLRYKHSYCFWCGIKYENEEDIEGNCPGVNEDDHD